MAIPKVWTGSTIITLKKSKTNKSNNENFVIYS